MIPVSGRHVPHWRDAKATGSSDHIVATTDAVEGTSSDVTR